ncbi:MAG: hypothetical protein ACJAXF_003289, partial [Polaribacter sp.]
LEYHQNPLKELYKQASLRKKCHQHMLQNQKYSHQYYLLILNLNFLV